MTTDVRVRHPIEVLYGGGTALACGLDGGLNANDLHGLFAGDTRVLSTYRMMIDGRPWQLLSRYRFGHGSAKWEYQNPHLRAPTGTVPEGSIFLDLRRRVMGALHDDLRLWNYAGHRLRATLVVQLDADFADVFEVKQQSIPARTGVGRVPGRDQLCLSYSRAGFLRGVRVWWKSSGARPHIVGSLVVVDVDLSPGDDWSCCLQAEPRLGEEFVTFSGDPHGEEPAPVPEAGRIVLRAPAVLQEPFERGCADLQALAIPHGTDLPFVAAGVPWFYTLFGRDSLLPGLMAGIIGAWPLLGALAAVGDLQADRRDDWRDAEPGKLPHELRRGEIAHFNVIPHTPYYGSHDAPTLYCLALWSAWRWTGDASIVNRHLDVALRALQWCDELGDRDGDGLQEYGTRSARGYYNQGWKDAEDAIVHEDGPVASLPLATIELQGYLYAARLAIAELLDDRGDATGADRLRDGARELRRRVEETYWMEEQQFYALALDGHKRPVTSIASNPGHLLWTGLPQSERAHAVIRRLMASDMSSGWGLRTLSSRHTRYNPLSYQRGSVWPHDTALAAAGMARFGFREDAAALIKGTLEAACALEDARLPELFCGFDRSLGPPVPYSEANIPQAWAAATGILAVQLFLGLVPDAPANRCFVDPWLPDWLPRLEVGPIEVGTGTFEIVLEANGPAAEVRKLVSRNIDVIERDPAAPLWGRPLSV